MFSVLEAGMDKNYLPSSVIACTFDNILVVGVLYVIMSKTYFHRSMLSLRACFESAVTQWDVSSFCGRTSAQPHYENREGQRH